MANEFTTNFVFQLVNGYLKETFTKSGTQYSQTTQGVQSGVWVIGTSEENLSVGDVATLGFTILHNLDSTNYFEYGMSDSGTMKATGKLKAGEFAFLRLKPGITLRAQANTASVRCQYYVFED